MFESKTLTQKDKELLKEKYPNDYEKQIEKVKKGYPVQYLIGNVDFLNTNILVNGQVLIPRFETEYLVEKVLKKVEKYKENNFSCIDICTGSGCIAIGIAKNTNFKVEGIDISKEALQVARKNAKRNHVTIEWKQIDILKNTILPSYDIIIANPPYIDKEEEVDPTTQYEPQMALFAGEHGLIFYKKIIEQIQKKPKLIAFEIGEKQGAKIIEMLRIAFPTAKITIEQDLCGKDRYIFTE